MWSTKHWSSKKKSEKIDSLTPHTINKWHLPRTKYMKE